MALHYHHHNTRDDVRRYLDEAAEVVEECNLGDDLRLKAFELAVGLLAAKLMIGTPSVIPASGRVDGS